MADIELLSKAIESFNATSSTIMQYYRTLEEKVTLLTEEVDHKKQLLDSILDSIDVGVVFFDSDGVIRLINNAAEKLLNVDAETLVGGVSLHASIREEVIMPENGNSFYALVSRSDVKDGKANSIGHVLIFKDITRLKQLEAENERNRRLSAMGELVLKIAHEIRNPLGSIELFASLLAGDLKGSEHGDYAGRISNSVRSLVNTLDNMLRFTKEINPHLEYCCLNDIITEILREFGELFSRDNVVSRFTEEGRCWLSVDSGLIRQAVINILLNSAQAMPDGGTIEITLKGRMKSEELDAVEIMIRDSGTGMNEDTRVRIFEPFYSTKDRGSGLGMSITEGIIKAHCGTISVESEPGKGTLFLIVLPAGDKHE